MSNLQFPFIKLGSRHFQPSLIGLVLTVLAVMLFVKLGLWQYRKAETKLALQAIYNQYEHASPVALPIQSIEPEQWRYRQVLIRGEYLPKYQIFLDNQTEGEQVGYHVITPIKITGTNRVVLVNRGWIPALDQHVDVPAIQTPQGVQEVVGQVWLPSQKFFSLGAEATQAYNDWQPIWQNMDMKRFAQQVPYTLLPVAIKLNADNASSGFVRNWVRPDDRATMHIGYAYQWFGFAFAAIAIFIVVSFKSTHLNR